MSWVLERVSEDLWLALSDVGLVGRERKKARGRVQGPILEVLLLPDVPREFGVADPVKAALAWAWERQDGQRLNEVAQRALAKVSLLSPMLGARVPLVEAGRMMGVELTRAALEARGFLVDTV